MMARTWSPALAAGASVLPPHHADRPPGLLMYFDSDLRPVRVVNDWIVYTAQVKALSTANEYARAVARFARFLDERFNAELVGPEVRTTGDSLLRAYGGHLVAAREEDGPLHLGASRAVVGKARAALMSFYTYAVSEGWLPEFPFTLRAAQTRHGEVQTLAYLQGGRITAESRDPIPRGQLTRFHEVGLLGRRPGGDPDPAFRSYGTAQRSAAGFGLAVAIGLRHDEVLHTTVFEVPQPHPDGLTPARVANAISKGGRGRQVVALSEWLDPVHEYISVDRRSICRRATWEPDDPLYVQPEETNAHKVTVVDSEGRRGTYRWNDVGRAIRRRMVIPGNGSPLLLLDHSKRNGAPLTDQDALNTALAHAGERCGAHWPDHDWAFTTHHLRHTFATELTHYLAQADDLAAAFEEESGRPPAWADLLRHQDKTRIVQESMGHSSPAMTNRYRQAAFWSLLLSVTADPEHNPAVREDAS